MAKGCGFPAGWDTGDWSGTAHGPRVSLRSRDRRDGLPVGLQLEAVADDEPNEDIAIQAEDGDVFPIPGIDRDRESDLGAVRGPGRGSLRGRAVGQLHQARAVAPDRPQVPVPSRRRQGGPHGCDAMTVKRVFGEPYEKNG